MRPSKIYLHIPCLLAAMAFVGCTTSKPAPDYGQLLGGMLGASAGMLLCRETPENCQTSALMGAALGSTARDSIISRPGVREQLLSAEGRQRHGQFLADLLAVEEHSELARSYFSWRQKNGPWTPEPAPTPVSDARSAQKLEAEIVAAERMMSTFESKMQALAGATLVPLSTSKADASSDKPATPQQAPDPALAIFSAYSRDLQAPALAAPRQ